MSERGTTNVVMNDELSRFELAVDGHVAFITFERHGKTMTLLHTEVPEELEGRGVGAQLVRGALGHIRDNQLSVVPRCPFVISYLKRHPEEADDLGIDPTIL